MAAGFRLSLKKVQYVKVSSRGLDLSAAAKKQLFQDLDDNKPDTLDVLHGLFQTDPSTKRVTEASLYSVLGPANLFLDSVFNSLARTFKDESSFSKHTGQPDAVTNRSVQIQIDRSAHSPTRISKASPRRPWKNLSPSYLRRIGFMVSKTSKGHRVGKSGNYRYGGKTYQRPAQGPKRFWTERTRKGSSVKGNRGMRHVAAEELMGILAAAPIIGRRTPISLIGVENAFTVSADIKRSRQRTYQSRKRGGGRRLVHSVKGDLLFPSALRIADKFNDILYQLTVASMATGHPAAPQVNITSLLSGKTGDPDKDWLELLIANEKYRPWIAPWFSTLQKYLIDYIKAEAAADLERL